MRFGWDRWLGETSAFVGMTGSGASGPPKRYMSISTLRRDRGASGAGRDIVGLAKGGPNPMSGEPENLTLALLHEIRAELADVRENMATKGELANGLADVRSEIRSLRADVASDMMTLEKRLGDQIVGLRRASLDTFVGDRPIGRSIERPSKDGLWRAADRIRGAPAPVGAACGPAARGRGALNAASQRLARRTAG